MGDGGERPGDQQRTSDMKRKEDVIYASRSKGGGETEGVGDRKQTE